MKTFELKPIHKKSFYGKCKVEKIDNKLTLFSYNTDVAFFDDGKKLWITKNKKHLTATTLRHINAFLVYIGKDTMTKKQIINL